MASNMPHTESHEFYSKKQWIQSTSHAAKSYGKNMHIQCISHTKNSMNPIKKTMDLKHSLSSYTGWWHT